MTFLKRVAAVFIVTLLAFVSLTPVTAAPASSAALKAADYILAHSPTPTGSFGTGAVIDEVLALASTGDTRYNSAIASRVDYLKLNAPSYAGSDSTAAAKLAIVAAAVGEDATDFGGVNLIAVVRNGIGPDGSFGSWPGPFASGLGMMALKRNGVPVPPEMVDFLKTYRVADGSFGFTPGSASGDVDSTALAILGFQASGTSDPALAEAIAWLERTQRADGSWDAYSPVNSAGLAGPLVSPAPAAAATNYVTSQQVGSGGLRTGAAGVTNANLMATTQGILALDGQTYLSIDYPLTPVRLTVTAASAGTKPVGQATNAWGTVTGSAWAEVWTEVLINGSWSRSQTGRTDAAGWFTLPLTYGANTPGSYTYRVAARTSTGVIRSAQFTLTRTATVTAHSAGTKRVGEPTNAWGNAGIGNTKVWTEALVNGRWSTSQITTSKADGSYVLPLTYGVNTPGSYTYRVAAQTPSGVIRSAQFTLTRTATVTAHSAGTKRVGEPTNAWGNAGIGNTKVWTEALVNGRWSTSQITTSKADGSYVLPLTYGVNTPGSYTYRVAAQTPSGVIRSAQFTLQRVSAN